MLVLAPLWVVLVHERIGARQSTHYGVDICMGQRRSHVVQILIYF